MLRLRFLRVNTFCPAKTPYMSIFNQDVLYNHYCDFKKELIFKINLRQYLMAVVNIDVYNLVKCANFAALKHKDQRRKDPAETPYINHPLGVANILTEEGGITDVPTILAAILHDTVEDTATTFEEIEQEFGSEVVSIVKEVTDDKSLPYDERKRLQIVHAPTCSYKAKLVKLADKLYNLRDLIKCTPVGWSDGRVERYFEWAKQVVDGLRGTNQALEQALDQVFSHQKL